MLCSDERSSPTCTKCVGHDAFDGLKLRMMTRADGESHLRADDGNAACGNNGLFHMRPMMDDTGMEGLKMLPGAVYSGIASKDIHKSETCASNTRCERCLIR